MSLVALISKGRLLACSKVTSTNVTFFEVTSLEVTSPENDVLRGEFFKATSFPGDVLQNEIPEGGHDIGGDVSQSFEVRRIPRFVHQLSEATAVGSTFVVPAAVDPAASDHPAAAVDPDSRRNGVARYELRPADGAFRLSVLFSRPTSHGL